MSKLPDKSWLDSFPKYTIKEGEELLQKDSIEIVTSLIKDKSSSYLVTIKNNKHNPQIICSCGKTDCVHIAGFLLYLGKNGSEKNKINKPYEIKSLTNKDNDYSNIDFSELERMISSFIEEIFLKGIKNHNIQSAVWKNLWDQAVQTNDTEIILTLAALKKVLKKQNGFMVVSSIIKLLRLIQKKVENNHKENYLQEQFLIELLRDRYITSPQDMIRYSLYFNLNNKRLYLESGISKREQLSTAYSIFPGYILGQLIKIIDRVGFDEVKLMQYTFPGLIPSESFEQIETQDCLKKQDIDSMLTNPISLLYPSHKFIVIKIKEIKDTKQGIIVFDQNDDGILLDPNLDRAACLKLWDLQRNCKLRSVVGRITYYPFGLMLNPAGVICEVKRGDNTELELICLN